ncbi:MAG: DUF1287 domain-containing protein [Armatimonadetes bacterium]|nr:DUF1287 domain-containing protein [Armatimonadota bacterium]
MACAPPSRTVASSSPTLTARRTTAPNKVIEGALRQLEKPASYDDAYVAIAYPNGDVAADRGACADVVVRAYRHAGVDLQRLIHEDAGTGRYPRIQRTDKNIDHRRVLNQEVFFRRHGRSLTTDVTPQTVSQWKPGDIVSWRLSRGRTHIGVVSDRRRPDGVPLVIHNIGRVSEDDSLTRWAIAGHFRYRT